MFLRYGGRNQGSSSRIRWVPLQGETLGFDLSILSANMSEQQEIQDLEAIYINIRHIHSYNQY